MRSHAEQVTVLTFLVTLAALVGDVRPAAAAPITFAFTGSVTQFTADPGDPFAGTIDFGTSIAGSYTFDSAAADAIAAASSGSYQMTGSPFGLWVTMGGKTFSTSDFLAINVANNFAGPVDQYGVLACAGGASCSGDLMIELFLQDNQATAFSSDALPLAPPGLLPFEIRSFSLFGTADGNQFEIQGSIDSLASGDIVDVPEPATGLLVLSGLIGGLWRRRRNYV